MEKKYKALKIRIYPNVAQTTQINKTLGCSRFIFNQMLYERKSFYEENKDDTRKVYEYKYKTEKEYKQEFEWLKEADSQALQQSRIDLSNAYSNFFKSLKGKRKDGKVGFPKFKRKKLACSYRSCIINNNIDISFENKKVKLPKIGWVNFRDKRINFPGVIKAATVSRTLTGKYFVSLRYEYSAETKVKNITNPNKVIGLDMSLQNFYVDNKGNSPDYQRNTRKYELELEQAQRNLSRKKLYSKNWYKAKFVVSKIYEKITNSRKDFTRKLVTNLVNKYDAICIETLSLKEMSQNLKLGKSVHDLGYAEFVSKLKQKAEETGSIIIEADKWFASSKLCNVCGYKNKDLQLSDRNWTCPKCATTHNRDTNAGLNLQKLGLKIISLGQTNVEKMLDDEAFANSQFSLKQEAHRLQA